MSQELQLGKYEFYPYEFDESKIPSLEELVELLKKLKSGKKDVKAPVPSISKQRAKNLNNGFNDV